MTIYDIKVAHVLRSVCSVMSNRKQSENFFSTRYARLLAMHVVSFNSHVSLMKALNDPHNSNLVISLPSRSQKTISLLLLKNILV